MLGHPDTRISPWLPPRAERFLPSAAPKTRRFEPDQPREPSRIAREAGIERAERRVLRDPYLPRASRSASHRGVSERGRRGQRLVGRHRAPVPGFRAGVRRGTDHERGEGRAFAGTEQRSRRSPEERVCGSIRSPRAWYENAVATFTTANSGSNVVDKAIPGFLCSGSRAGSTGSWIGPGSACGFTRPDR